MSSTILTATESALTSFAQSLVGPSANCYPGIDNQDKAAPAVISVGRRCQELYYGTNVWTVDAEVIVKEIAFDTEEQDIGDLAETVFDGFSAIQNRASNLTNNDYVCYTVIPHGPKEQTSKDAWIQTLELKI